MLHICMIIEQETIDEIESSSCSTLTDKEDVLNEVINILALLFELTIVKCI